MTETDPASPHARHQDAITVAGVAVGGAVAITVEPGHWDLSSILLGLMLLLILTGLVHREDIACWNWRARAGYALVVGLCVTIMSGWVMELLVGHLEPDPLARQLGMRPVDYGTLVIWSVSAVVAWGLLPRLHPSRPRSD